MTQFTCKPVLTALLFLFFLCSHASGQCTTVANIRELIDLIGGGNSLGGTINLCPFAFDTFELCNPDPFNAIFATFTNPEASLTLVCDSDDMGGDCVFDCPPNVVQGRRDLNAYFSISIKRLSILAPNTGKWVFKNSVLRYSIGEVWADNTLEVQGATFNTLAGNGVSCSGSCSISDSIFRGLTSEAVAASGNLNLTNCLFEDIIVDRGGGRGTAASFRPESSSITKLQVTDCTVQNNIQLSSPGFYIAGNAEATFLGMNVFRNNTARELAAPVVLEGGATTVGLCESSIFERNINSVDGSVCEGQIDVSNNNGRCDSCHSEAPSSQPSWYPTMNPTVSIMPTTSLAPSMTPAPTETVVPSVAPTKLPTTPMPVPETPAPSQEPASSAIAAHSPMVDMCTITLLSLVGATALFAM